MSWVARVTMKGCRENLATKKPLMKPTMEPTIMTATMAITIYAAMGRSGSHVKILLAQSGDWSRAAEMAADRPTTRPAERSVPVRTIQPPIPRAMGREAAAREMMLTMEPGFRKFSFLKAV